ncbi:hypothetical protein KIW84_051746 [Lathyrus oleraceus]|uniref:Uncharacterized protein n=1 Tax=Pisum sativum TaxID=3888 RepID=A0A9D4WMX0_PEA|nr:hypothetical protein KIW84_051746 [Pisum sativum]
MSIILQGIAFSVDFFVLVIEGPDVVLGFPWLQSLGKVAHEYSALTMEFTWQGVPVTLVGDPSLLRMRFRCTNYRHCPGVSPITPFLPSVFNTNWPSAASPRGSPHSFG